MRREAIPPGTPPGVSTSTEKTAFISTSQLLTKLPMGRRTLYDHLSEFPSLKVGRRRLWHWPSVEAALLRRQRGAE